MKPLILIVLALMATTVTAQRSTRPRVSAKQHSAATVGIRHDTIVAPEGIVLRGYDKPLRSRRESMFVSNNRDNDTIAAIALTIDYLDTSGKQLHRGHYTVPCQLPPHQTRQITIPAWDNQQKFYYVRSQVPRSNTQATPFDVKAVVDTVYVERL